MSTRVRTVIIAIVFGCLATISVAFYINSLRAQIIESGVKQKVLVATEDIIEGTAASAIMKRGQVKTVEVPKRYLAQNALASLDGYGNRVLTSPLGRGEQLTGKRFRSEEKSAIANKLPAGRLAMAISVDEVTGVGGKIQAGDKIFVLATFEPGPGGTDITRVLLRDIKVLDAPTEAARTGAAATVSKSTITLAVTPSQAEKLVFAEEKGAVWISLSPAGSRNLPGTTGETMESIFR